MSRIDFRNDSGETIPAGGIMRITGVVLVKGQPVVKVDKPNTYGGRQGKYLVNGLVPILDGKTGIAQPGPLYSVYFYATDAASPASGEQWGPVDGQWYARRYVHGFRIVGLPESGQKLVLCTLDPMKFVRVRPDADIAKDASGTCSVYHGNNPVSLADSTYNVTVTNPYAGMTAGYDYLVVPTGDDDFEPVVGECTA